MFDFVETEGDRLFYRVQGTGTPLLLIAPGGGDCDQYEGLAEVLAGRFKVIRYDRRANARSTRHFPDTFSVRQQSRDALAVLHAAGEEKAFVFGNSSGAVIALDLVTAFAETVLGAFVHEAPVAEMSTQPEKWRSFFESCHTLAQNKGAARGATRFFFGIEMPAISLISATLTANKRAKRNKEANEPDKLSSTEASEVLLFNELLPITTYRPDIADLRKHREKIWIGCGNYGLTHHKWYAEVAERLAQEIGCALLPFPGHHGSFMDQPKAFAVPLQKSIDAMAPSPA